MFFRNILWLQSRNENKIMIAISDMDVRAPPRNPPVQKMAAARTRTKYKESILSRTNSETYIN